MTYFIPYVDDTGFHIPTYDDILQDLIDKAKSIFGNDIYLDNDSLDYQLISIFASKIYDDMQMAQLIDNNKSVSSAVGTALDSLVRLNGIIRTSASYSTCQVKVIGTGGTSIISGVVEDSSGYKWNLPSLVIIGSLGFSTVTATCQTLGAIPALVGDITSISTPTSGWLSVTNDVAAVVGQNVESDSALRARQAISTALPSRTLFQATIAAVAAIPGVTRYAAYENNTGNVDSNGLAAHSIAFVVEGGSDEGIANAIYLNKGPGCGLNGTTTVTIVDDVYNYSLDIDFYRPSYVIIYVHILIHKLVGWVDDTEGLIHDAVFDYLNSLAIGQTLTVSGVEGAALSVLTNLSRPTFSIRGLEMAEVASPLSTDDIEMDYDEVSYAVASPDTITIEYI